MYMYCEYEMVDMTMFQHDQHGLRYYLRRPPDNTP